MTGLLTLRNLLWLTTTATEMVLLAFLIRRKFQSTHIAFVLYVLCTILQSGLAAFIYSWWGFNTALASNVIWASQGVVISLRFAAVFEMARRIFLVYAGLWSFAKRLLGTVGLGVVAYSLIVSKKDISSLVLNLDRGLELAIATFVVSVLLFARFYLLPVPAFDRALAVGFAMYSCFYVINDTLFEKLLGGYIPLWGYLDVLTFLASLLIWSQAVKSYPEAATASPASAKMPVTTYTTISPELNVRLRQLNEQLSHLLRVEKQSS